MVDFANLQEKAHKGPWITAVYTTYDGCSGCGGDIIEGETEIRADGNGGWECRDNCSDGD